MDNLFKENESLNLPGPCFKGVISFDPHPELKPYVYSYSYITLEKDSFTEFVLMPFPTGNIRLFINLTSFIQLYDKNFCYNSTHQSYIMGVFSPEKRAYISATGSIEKIMVNFRPGGFTRLFNIKASVLKNKVIDLELLLKEKEKNILNKLIRSDDELESIFLLDELLLQLFKKNSFKSENNYQIAIDIIDSRQGIITLSELSKLMKIATRTLERFFNDYVGTSPKKYICIVRFNCLMEYILNSINLNKKLLSLNEPMSNSGQLIYIPTPEDSKSEQEVAPKYTEKGWSEITHRFGYYDQSHFINDFKSVSGYTPAHFIKLLSNGDIWVDSCHIILKKSDWIKTLRDNYSFML